MTKKPTLGEILVMAGGALTLIFSFFPWIAAGSESVNAWSTAKPQPSMFLWATWVPIFAIIIAGFYALKVFAGGLPERVWDYSWDQLAFIAGLFCSLITLGVLVADKGGAHSGWALILSFITSLAILVGAVLDKLGVGANVLANVGRGARGDGAPQQPWSQQPSPGQPWSQQPGYGEQAPTSYPPAEPPTAPPPESPPPTQPAPTPPPPQTPPPRQTPPPPGGGEPPPTEPPPGTTGF